MTSQEVVRINERLKYWKGATASFNHYTNTHNRFVLEVSSCKQKQRLGISFVFCEFITGPTHWTNCDLKCNLWPQQNGAIGYEVRDDGVGFIVKGSDTVVFGDGE